MSSTHTTTCDGCGRVLRDDAADVPAERQVDLQMNGDIPAKVLATSIDPHEEGRLSYEFRSVGWDLCVPCAVPVYQWLTERFGKAGHDSLGEVLA